MSGRRPSTAAILAGGATLLAFALLYAPLLATAIASFNASRVGFVWRGFSLEGYRRLAENRELLEAARNSLLLATVSTAIATPVGTLLALGLDAAPWPGRVRRGLEGLIDLPVVTPDLIFAAALVAAYSTLSPWIPLFRPGMPAMIVGHVAFQIPFVALVVRGRAAALGDDVYEAASDLYASPARRFLAVTLPLLAPAIGAGGLLAFCLSLDDFAIGFFVSSPRSTTLPMYVHSSMRRGLGQELHAVATLFVALSAVATLLFALLVPNRNAHAGEVK